MTATYSIKLTKFEKTGSILKFLYFAGNLKTKFHFRNTFKRPQKSITFFVAFQLSLFDSGVGLPSRKQTELRKIQKSNCEKVNLSLNKF